MPRAYYNENDPFAAQWLRNLITNELIARGDVDDRSILDVRGADLVGYDQCHFFAGIGGWSLALRLAGWADDRPVWTGSCPCQPLSVAGSRQGEIDERHLWPAFCELIRERHPQRVFGEQVASANGREWLSGVHADLEGMDYAFGAADLCAAGVGAPHIRQRLYWVADASGEGLSRSINYRKNLCIVAGASSTERSNNSISPWVYDCTNPYTCSSVNGFRRPVEQLRAYGNAIVPQVAAEFIAAVMECIP